MSRLTNNAVPVGRWELQLELLFHVSSSFALVVLHVCFFGNQLDKGFGRYFV